MEPPLYFKSMCLFLTSWRQASQCTRALLMATMGRLCLFCHVNHNPSKWKIGFKSFICMHSLLWTGNPKRNSILERFLVFLPYAVPKNPSSPYLLLECGLIIPIVSFPLFWQRNQRETFFLAARSSSLSNNSATADSSE